MKIIPASYSVYDTKYRKNNVLPRKANSNDKFVKNQVAFGSLAGSFKSGSTKALKFIERAGFFILFLIVDGLFLIIPRIVVGFFRGKKTTGKYNYKAAAEEAGREGTSGPSMNLIPMGGLAVISAYKPAARMERDTLKSLTYNLTQIVEESSDAGKIGNNEQLTKAFADKLFEDAFGKFKLDDKTKLKAEFNRLLNESKDLKSKEFKNKVKEFEAHIALINNKNRAVVPVNAKLIKLHTGEGDKVTSVRAKDLLEDFRAYSKDVIQKLTKQDFCTNASNNYKSEAKNFLEKIKKSRFVIKLVTAITAFFAVGAFLSYLPKLYQQGNVSPAEESARLAEGGCA